MEVALIGIADGVDGHIVVAVCLSGEGACVVGGGRLTVNLGCLDDTDVQGLGCGSRASQHLEALGAVLCRQTHGDIVALACFHVQGHGNEIVIGSIVPVVAIINIFIVGTVLPSRFVFVVVDDRKAVEVALVSETDGERHLLGHSHLDGHDVTLAALSGGVRRHSLILVSAFCRQLVGVGLLRAGSHVGQRLDGFAVAHDGHGEVVRQRLAADGCRRGSEGDGGLQFKRHLRGGEVGDRCGSRRVGSHVNAEAIDAQHILVGRRGAVDGDVIHAVGRRRKGAAVVGRLVLGRGLVDDGRGQCCCRVLRSGHHLELLGVVPRGCIDSDLVGLAAHEGDGQH